MSYLLNVYYLLIENLNYYGMLLLVFLAVVSMLLALYFVFNRQSEVKQRLGRFVPQQDDVDHSKPRLVEEQNGFVTKVVKPLHDMVAPTENETKKRLRLKLIQGGFRSERAVQNYLALKIVLAALLPGVFLFARYFYSFSAQVVAVAACLTITGFFLPNIILNYRTKARKQNISKALPDALDLMVVCVEAGLGLDMTFKRVGIEIRPISSDLSDEFKLTNLEASAGRPRDETYKNMADRTGVAEVSNLMTLLIQTNRFGTSLAKTLRVHAEAMRIKRRQLAEERAAKAAVKLVIPLVFFIFPALFVVLLGPAAIRIITILLPVLGGE
jgi:tight adherence protein C